MGRVADTIFFAALDIDSPAERAAFVDQACDGDEPLRRRVHRLLEVHASQSGFLATPAVDRSEFDPGGSFEDPTEFTHADGPSGAAREDSDQGERSRGSISATTYGLLPSDMLGSLGRLDHYEVLEVVGRGGFGIVVRAFDTKLHRQVAMKLLSPRLARSDEQRHRFVVEARSAAAIRDEHVVAIYAVEDRANPYLVMEYIAGKTLQQRLEWAGQMSIPDVLRIGRQVAAGLAAAHAIGLVHRDIKPDNILLEGDAERVKLTDFGLAVMADDDDNATPSGWIAGTPMYMSPEQAWGEAVDQRSDLFSLGSVLYAMCAGRPPFDMANGHSVVERIRTEAPRPLREIVPEIPRWLDELIANLHSRDPADRTLTAGEVADRFHEALPTTPRRSSAGGSPAKAAGPATTAITGEKPAWPREAARHRSRRRTRVAALLMVGLGALGLTGAARVLNLDGTVIRLLFPEGTVVVEVDDPGISVTLDGSDVVITGAGVREIRMKPGSYTLEATRDGNVVTQEMVRVVKDGRHVVRVRREAPTKKALAVAAEPAAKPADAADWERRVALLPETERERAVLSRLDEVNPGFVNQSLVSLQNLDLALRGPHLRDLSPLRALPNLRKLHIEGPDLRDLSPLRGMTLTRLDIVAENVSDLSPLQGMDLQELDLTGSGRVSDLSPLQGLPIRTLTIAFTGVADLAPIKELRLTALNADSSKITDLSPLRGMSLKYLHIAKTRVTDLSPIRGMALETLYISNSRVTDLSPLRGMPLRFIQLDPETQLDVEFLRSIKTLEFINKTPVEEFWKAIDDM